MILWRHKMVSMKFDNEGNLNINIRIGIDEEKALVVPRDENIFSLKGSSDIFSEVIKKVIRVFGEYDGFKGRVMGGPGEKNYEIIIKEIKK